MDLERLAAGAERLRNAYAEYNCQAGRAQWDAVDYAAGLAGDVGDLVKLVMAGSARRDAPADLRERLVHELNDCLWSVLVIAGQFDVDLAQTFTAHVEDLERSLDVTDTRCSEPGHVYLRRRSVA